MKKNWIIILIIFLLVTNAALVSTLIISHKKQDSHGAGIPGKNKDISERRKQRFEQSVSEKLSFSEKQREHLREFSDDFTEEKHTYYRKMSKLKQQYFEELTSGKSEYELRAFADSLGNIHAHMMFLDYQHYQNIRSICNEEQAMKFDSLGRHHLSKRESYRKRHGDGRRHHRSNDQSNINTRNYEDEE